MSPEALEKAHRWLELTGQLEEATKQSKRWHDEAEQLEGMLRKFQADNHRVLSKVADSLKRFGEFALPDNHEPLTFEDDTDGHTMCGLGPQASQQLEGTEQ